MPGGKTMSRTYAKFTVAAVQAASDFYNLEKTTDKAVLLIEEAADKSAAIIGFPELFIPGHPSVTLLRRARFPTCLRQIAIKKQGFSFPK